MELRIHVKESSPESWSKWFNRFTGSLEYHENHQPLCSSPMELDFYNLPLTSNNISDIEDNEICLWGII